MVLTAKLIKSVKQRMALIQNQTYLFSTEHDIIVITASPADKQDKAPTTTPTSETASRRSSSPTDADADAVVTDVAPGQIIVLSPEPLSDVFRSDVELSRNRPE